MADAKELLARIDVSALYPPFYKKVVAVLEACEKDGHRYYITCGERTWAQQDALYAKGRRGVAGEGKVTNAKAGSSAHNYAIAVDGARDGDLAKAGLQPIWKSDAYKPFADTALKFGLDAGYYWKSLMDGPHIQLDLKRHGITIAKLKEVYLKGGKDGKAAVFKFLDQYDWS